MILECTYCRKEFKDGASLKKVGVLSGRFCSRKCANVYNVSHGNSHKKQVESMREMYKNMTEERREEWNDSLVEAHANMSPEKKLHRSQALRNDWKNKTSEERVSKLSGIRQGKGDFKKGQTPWNLGLTKDTDPRVAKYVKSGAKTRKERPLTEKQIQANRIRKVGKKASPESIERYRLSAQKRNREDMNYWKNLRKALNLKPNKAEKKLDRILQSILPGEYKYVGDFSLIIGGKCPDFFNVNGQKKLIELFGDYWHRDDIPEERAEFFKPFGFQTLIIWEHELQNKPKLMAKLKQFNKV